MHPASTFHWTDRAGMLEFVRAHAFGTLVDSALRVTQVPVIVDEPSNTLVLHVSRGNPISRALPARVVAVFGGAHGYVSPHWYAKGDQVPTWNYESVEIVGTLTATDDAMLPAILSRLGAEHEGQIPGKAPWTLDEVSAATREKLLQGIVGATLAIETMRGTQKLSQNKTPDDIDGVVAGLRRSGSPHDAELAERMASFNGRRQP